jgi:aspartyl-tRNA(Asn)/glutamyl-tRNA(Gln) amidotransferase subunit C
MRKYSRRSPDPTEMSLTPDDVRRLARLARLALEPEESHAVLEQLNRVLGLVEEMRRVDTQGVEPMAHAVDVTQRLRSDEVRAQDRRDVYQSVAPAVEDGLYLVPKVIE